MSFLGTKPPRDFLFFLRCVSGCHQFLFSLRAQRGGVHSSTSMSLGQLATTLANGAEVEVILCFKGIGCF